MCKLPGSELSEILSSLKTPCFITKFFQYNFWAWQRLPLSNNFFYTIIPCFIITPKWIDKTMLAYFALSVTLNNFNIFIITARSINNCEHAFLYHYITVEEVKPNIKNLFTQGLRFYVQEKWQTYTNRYFRTLQFPPWEYEEKNRKIRRIHILQTHFL